MVLVKKVAQSDTLAAACYRFLGRHLGRCLLAADGGRAYAVQLQSQWSKLQSSLLVKASKQLSWPPTRLHRSNAMTQYQYACCGIRSLLTDTSSGWKGLPFAAHGLSLGGTRHVETSTSDTVLVLILQDDSITAFMLSPRKPSNTSRDAYENWYG